MILSIRRFLLLSLLISITIASSIAAIGNYLLDKQVIQPYLDENLTQVAALVSTLSQLTDTPNPDIKSKIKTLLENKDYNPRHLQFQVWSKTGKLILHSNDIQSSALANVPLGFSIKMIKDDTWRIYAFINTSNDTKITVAELYNIRTKLADDITRNNAYILLITYPVLGILIWIIINLTLQAISRVTREISDRASTHLEPVNVLNIPIEIQPLVKALNQLFFRLHLAFEKNRRFAADAAHELRTPLAALKTQAQVALHADHLADQQHALSKVVQGVDRSAHVVTQLLTLSRLGQEDALNDIRPVDLHKLSAEIIAYLVPMALEKNVEIELASSAINPIIPGNDTALGILLRNVIDNAIRYTPAQGLVSVQIIESANHVLLRVIDTGVGIPLEMRDRVFERFYRILGTTATGSGLGLAIVHQIAELHHARISLATPDNGIGLQFDILFPHAP